MIAIDPNMAKRALKLTLFVAAFIDIFFRGIPAIIVTPSIANFFWVTLLRRCYCFYSYFRGYCCCMGHNIY